MSPEFTDSRKEDLVLKINTYLEPISTSYVLSKPGQFRQLLTQLIARSPITDVSIMFLLRKHRHLTATLSESGNFPLHEAMMLHASKQLTIGQEVIETIVLQYPEALCAKNADGFTPLHCLLQSPIYSERTSSLIRIMTKTSPQCARYDTLKLNKILLSQLLMRYIASPQTAGSFPYIYC